MLDRTPETGCASADGLERGAYTLWESEPGAHPDLILIGTGSEVSLALEAARTLAEAGSLVRVVSMPCWELFELEDDAYQAEVLPPDVGARLAIEAGVTLGWQRWVGDRGGVLGVDRFGASAPGATVLAEYGFTVDNVVEQALAIREHVA